MGTLLELRTDARAMLDETTAGFWTDAQLNYWLNEGNLDLAARLEDLEASDTQSTAASDYQYDLPTDCIKVKRVQYDSFPLAFIGYNDLNKYEAVGDPSTSETGTPQYFYLWNNDIFLYPTPTAIKNLTIQYYKRPATMDEDTDTPEHASQFHNLIVYYAVYKALVKDTLFTDADRMMGQYLNGVAEAKSQMMNRQRTQATMVRWVNE
jgi:hypothetical protein